MFEDGWAFDVLQGFGEYAPPDDESRGVKVEFCDEDGYELAEDWFDDLE